MGAGRRKASAVLFGVSFLSILTSVIPSSSGAVLAEPLRGGVQQYDVAKGWIPNERLPLADWEKKVARRLKTGLAWSDNLLPQQGADVKWVQIPAWLAGHWHIDRAKFTLDKTGLSAPETTNVEDDIFGFQQDRNGNYWNMLRNPTINMTEGPDVYSRFVHYEQNGEMVSNNHFVLDSDNLEVRVSKKTGRITAVRRRHDAYAWQISGGGVEANDRVQFLDSSFRPKGDGSGTVKARPARIGPYVRVDMDNEGLNLRESFKSFLQKSGKSDLVPTD